MRCPENELQANTRINKGNAPAHEAEPEESKRERERKLRAQRTNNQIRKVNATHVGQSAENKEERERGEETAQDRCP